MRKYTTVRKMVEIVISRSTACCKCGESLHHEDKKTIFKALRKVGTRGIRNMRLWKNEEEFDFCKSCGEEIFK